MNTKKYLLVLLLSFVVCKTLNAQILCIYCYDQNIPISNPVNNLVTNGSFEYNNCNTIIGCFCPNSDLYNCDITSWLCTGGGSLTYAKTVNSTVSIIPDGIVAAYFGNYFCHVCSITENDTSCITHVDCTVTGVPTGDPNNNVAYGGATGVSLEQTVSGLTIGNSYALEFWAGGEDYTSFINDGLFAVDVGFGDTLLMTPPTDTGEIGRIHIVQFRATSVSQTIKFTNWGHICNLCTELILDNVRLYTLAELPPSVPHCNVSINEINENASVNLYSNPVSGLCVVSCELCDEETRLRIFDLMGKEVYTALFTHNFQLSTDNLPSGIYMVKILTDQGEVVKKVVVE